GRHDDGVLRRNDRRSVMEPRQALRSLCALELWEILEACPDDLLPFAQFELPQENDQTLLPCAELCWEREKVVVLTSRQAQNRDQFEACGFSVHLAPSAPDTRFNDLVLRAIGVDGPQ
ncbi:MAG: hypothetical protein WCI74_19240, partial [Actinomycetes bacterium]